MTIIFTITHRGIDGSYERVILSINPLCNIQLGTGGVEDDTFTLKLTVQIYNKPMVSGGELQYFGVGAKYSGSQVWVAQLQLDLFPEVIFLHLTHLD